MTEQPCRRIPAAATLPGGCTARRGCDGAPCWLAAGHRGVHEVHPFQRCRHGRVFTELAVHCLISRAACEQGCVFSCYSGALAAAVPPAQAWERSHSGRQL